MKTKIFFFLATMMLCSASAFAQSGNNEPLQGDVNEDGIVDVADIAAIIEIIKDQGGEIYYWYVGHVTNSQVENNQLASVVNGQNPTTNTDGPSTLTIPTTTGDALVYIYPTVWGTPTIKSQNNFGTGDMGLEEVGLTPPTGYGVRFWDGDSSVRGTTVKITWTK
jgi:hypothetical protein